MTNAFIKATDLPGVIPVFPLDGALLLPHGAMPLNVFEPRYLNMIDDAMAGDRIIGMVQTIAGGDRERPRLAQVGCAGRITAFAETGDGRYLITLTGMARFRTGDELPSQGPYRQVRADFAAYPDDMEPAKDDPDFDRGHLEQALRVYLEHRGLRVDWGAAEAAPLDALVNSLCMALPFDPPEKQALLEAPAPVDRRDALVALLEIDGTDSGDDGAPPSVQ
jgi:Lon protease-like protein